MSELFQHGTLALLVPGLLEGTISIQDVLKHGDTGIGTGQGLDGELIVLDGTAYQVNGEGKVTVVNDTDFKLPFCDVHFAEFKPLKAVENLKMRDVEKTVFADVDYRNIFFGVKMTGNFSKVKARSVNKQDKPYPSLTQTADQQSVFNHEDINGTIIGYYSPHIFNGPAVGGFHLHFISEDKTVGGHLLDFELSAGKISLQPFETLTQHFPVDNQEFMSHDFEKDDIASAIDYAEK